MSTNTLPALRPGLYSAKPYTPGRPLQEVLEEFGLTSAHKLASNENLFGVSPKAMAALREAIEGVGFYPDTNSLALAEKIASRVGVKAEEVKWGNGTVELIYDLANIYLEPGDEVVMGAPSFVAYPIATRINQGVPVEVPCKEGFQLDLDAMLEAITPRTKLVFVPNPNNPTGTLIKKKDLESFLGKLPSGVLAVIDEAYHDFITDPDYPDSMALYRDGAPILVMRSQSKSLGLAGLRVGYCVAPAEVTAALRQIQIPFHVNVPAQAAALAGLDDQEFLDEMREKMSEARDFVHAELDKRGIEYVPCHANFFMMKLKMPAEKAGHELMKKGIIVRPGDNLGAPNWLRVTVGPIPVMEDFFRAVDELEG